MLGQPVSMLIPQVVGFKLTASSRRRDRDRPRAHRDADAAQEGRRRQVRRVLRRRPREPAARRPRDDRATWRPSTAHLRQSSRSTPRRCATSSSPAARRSTIELVEAYAKAQGLFRTDDAPARYTDTLELDLATVEPSLAGPKRPQDRVPLEGEARSAQTRCGDALKTRRRRARARHAASGSTARRSSTSRTARCVIAAITSCTNTSNPAVMIGGGLARAQRRGEGPHAQAVGEDELAPGSKVVTDYSTRPSLLDDARQARLQPRRLRLHDLHRQLGPAAEPRSPPRIEDATSSRAPCSRATATSRAASIRR